MPTVPVKAAGWRIEPPVSVAVAPAQRSAATAAAEPPDEPPGHQIGVGALGAPGVVHRTVIGGFVRRAHGELVHVELAEHDGAVLPEVLRDGRFVTRLETVEDVAAGLGVNAFGAEQVLDAERNAFERAGLAGGDARIRGLRHVAGLFRRGDDIGVQRVIGVSIAEI